jgi:hypothetical protein
MIILLVQEIHKFFVINQILDVMQHDLLLHIKQHEHIMEDYQIQLKLNLQKQIIYFQIKMLFITII